MRSHGLAFIRYSARGAFAALLVTAPLLPVHSQKNGLTRPVVLPAFDPIRPSCNKPRGLRRELVFVQDNEREFVQGIARGLASAASDRGLAYRVVRSDNSAAQMVRQVNTLYTNKIGAMVVAPIDPPSLSPSLRKMIGSGAYVGAIVPPPATTISPRSPTPRVTA